MSISMNSLCVECRLGKDLATARQLGTDEQATAFAKDHMKLFLSLEEGENSAYFGSLLEDLFRKHFNVGPDRFAEEKAMSNKFVMDRMQTLVSRVEAQEDPVYAALQFSILGNYIDFSALRGEVSFEELEKMLDSALEMDLSKETYASFCKDLETGKKLLYITDNAGEIGFDRIFAQQIQKAYPHLQITFCVRGGPIQNDATREDALAMDLSFPVIDSGNAVGGTVLSTLSPEAKQAMEEADVVIAKGMGNTETMYGCGYNVYYAFLVKCERVLRYFDKPMMTPMFIRDPNFT